MESMTSENMRLRAELAAAKAENARLTAELSRLTNPGLTPYKPLAADGYPEDMAQIANDCGMSWPADPQQRIEVLVHIVRVVQWWRHQYDSMSRAECKEKRYQHFRTRNIALAKKLTNVRRAAKEYMKGQRYQMFESLHTDNARLTAKLAAYKIEKAL